MRGVAMHMLGRYCDACALEMYGAWVGCSSEMGVAARELCGLLMAKWEGKACPLSDKIHPLRPYNTFDTVQVGRMPACRSMHALPVDGECCE